MVVRYLPFGGVEFRLQDVAVTGGIDYAEGGETF